MYHLKYRDVNCFTEDAVLMYSGIEFEIEVPEKMNELRNNSVVGLGKAEIWKMILVILNESQM